MKKKLFLIMLLLIGFVFAGCSGGVKVKISDFEYEKINDKIVLGKYIGDEKSIVVPYSVDGSYVYITTETFRNNTEIEYVKLKSDNYSLPAYAFEGCSNLKEVNIKNCNYIYEYAFKGCTNLTSIFINASDLHPTAFMDCCNLTEIKSSSLIDKKNTILYDSIHYKVLLAGKNAVIPDDAISIAPYAFYGRDGLRKVEIPESVETIGVNAFGGCNDLSVIKVNQNNKVYDSRENSNAIIEKSSDKLIQGCATTIIPNGVKTIGSYAFDSLSALNGITIPLSVKTIEPNAFNECSNVTSITVHPSNNSYDSRDNSNAIIETASNKLILACDNTTIPNSVKVIGNNSFNLSDKTTSVTLPAGVEKIEDEAFINMDSLTELVISSTVNEVGTNIVNKTNITSLVVDSSNPTFDSRNESNTINKTSENKIVLGTVNSVIDPTIKVIGSEAFSDNQKLTEIRIPDTVEIIEARAYYNCNNVEVIKLSDSIITIGEEAFMNCYKVSEITIPNSVTSIGLKAFANCNLWSIQVDAANPIYDSRDNCDAIIEKSSNKLVVASSNTIIPDSVTTIGKFSFYGINYKNIVIGKNVTLIENGAFTHLDSLLSIEVDDDNPVYDSRSYLDIYKDEYPSNCIIETSSNTLIVGCAYTKLLKDVTTIAEYAFSGNGVVFLTLSDVKTVGDYAFSDCNNLLIVTLPKKVEYVGKHAFSNCRSLQLSVKNNAPVEKWHPEWNNENCYIYEYIL